jgi:predicted acyltransferase
MAPLPEECVHMADEVTKKRDRLSSLDQLRGYAIFGMLLVNSSEVFGFKLEQLRHHRTSYSYADTIAPLFVFVVGITMRLSWLRHSAQVGPAKARSAMFKRFGLMVLIAFAIYAGWLWDALMDIGLAGLLALPLIGKKPRVRIAAAFAMVALYQAVVMLTIYGPWITRAIKLADENTPLLIRLVPLHEELFKVALNGGPLGPLSWCMMLLFGTVAYDWMVADNSRRFVVSCLGWGIGLCAAGYTLSAAWPSVKASWPISAYYMTAPFPLLSTGLCLLQLLAFYTLCDRLHLRIPTFTDVGMNPLVIYIAQCLVLDVAEGFEPPSFSPVVGVCAFAVFYGLFAGLAYGMRRRHIIVKI